MVNKIIRFAAEWCAPCRASFPEIARIKETYAPELTVVGISLDRNEKAWRKALAEEKCTWTQAWNQKGIAAKNYAVSAIPLLILIAPDGKIIGRYQKTEIGDILKKQFKR